MTASPKKHTFLAKTLYGLEEILAAELKAIGADGIEIMNRSVAFNGDREMLYKANLHLRTATRVLMPIKEFPVPDEQKLYQQVAAINWPRYFTVKETIAVDALVSHSSLTNSLYAAQKTKDAICDRFRAEQGKRPSVDLDTPDIRINLHIHENKATISLDASGESLGHRGYRLESGTAPLSEVLAAGIVYLTGWDGTINLIDPMCGSGTIVIEAALIARNIAPGINRKDFAFLNWRGADRKLFDRLVIEAKETIWPMPDIRIVGSDSDPKQISRAVKNARAAGVEKDILFSVKDFRDAIPPDPPGMVITNPPYGERQKISETARFYALIGDRLKAAYDGYIANVFTGNLKAAKQIGLRTSRRTKLYNSPLECRLLRYELYSGSRKERYRDNSE